MPFALIIIGVLLIVSGARGTYRQLGALLVGDLTGTRNFFVWIAAIFICGAIGFVPEARKFSRAFLALIILAMLFTNTEHGFIEELKKAFAGLGDSPTPDGPTPTDKPTDTPTPETPRDRATKDVDDITKSIKDGHYFDAFKDFANPFKAIDGAKDIFGGFFQ